MIDEAPIAMNGECNDWREIDRTLQGLARQRAALDANEAGWLRAAYRVQIWRHVGCVSMVRKGNEKGRVERPIGFVRSRFWRGRRFTDLLDLNTQAMTWRDDIANNRRHEETGKVPSLVFRHEEQKKLKPIPDTTFDVDDVETNPVTKTFRVTFDRNRYSVPWRLASQTVLVRAAADVVSIWLGKKQVAAHRRSWNVGDDIEHPSHREGLLQTKPRAAAGVP